MAMKYEQSRMNMVDCQIRTADVTQAGLLASFLAVPREVFVPEERKDLAYVDKRLEIAPGRALMTPASLARLVQALDVRQNDVVLDVGCGTGYSTAILSRICDSVLAVECDASLAAKANDLLSRLEYDNAVVVEGPLEAGYSSEAPYDAIFLGGAIEVLPESLTDQLRDGGRLIAVVGQGNAAVATIWMRDGEHVSRFAQFNCAVPPLPGFGKKAAFVF